MARRLARSFIRVLTATVLISAAGLAVLAAALRQPALTDLPFRGTSRASARHLEDHVRFLTSEVMPRSAGNPANLDRAADYIAERFRAAGGRTFQQTFHAYGTRYTNVLAEFGPEGSAEPVLIVGAHYDAFGQTGPLPGADDNASGTAGLLELARLLGASSPQTPVVLVAFTTEEPPFFGSDQMGSAIHANSVAAAGRSVRGMICLEMIGYFSPRQAWPNALFDWIYPSTGNFIGVVGGWADRKLALGVKRAMMGAGDLPVVSFSGPRETSDASDHRNYWSHGWSAVMITDTAFLRNPNYHTKRDTADTLDYRAMAGVVDGVLNAVLHLTASASNYQ